MLEGHPVVMSDMSVFYHADDDSSCVSVVVTYTTPLKSP